MKVILFLLIVLCTISGAQAHVFNEIPDQYSYNAGIMTDNNGITYEIGGNGYITVNDERNMGFALKGTINGETQTYTSMDFTWTWHHNVNENNHIFWAENGNNAFTWTQYWHFYADPNIPMKIEHHLENNYADITNTQMYYIMTVESSDNIRYNGTEYNIGEVLSSGNVHINGDINNTIFNFPRYFFDISDLLDDGFDLNEFYLGNGDVIEKSAIDIMAIGFTKNNGNFPKGADVWIDPSFGCGGWIYDSSVIAGLGDTGGQGSAPEVYDDSGTWKLIAGTYQGCWDSYYWSGSAWVSDSSIAYPGLTNLGSGSRGRLTVFNDSGTLKAITGEADGTFNGFYLSGSTWTPDSSIVAGLGSVAGRSSPTVYNDSGTWKLISGKLMGYFNGYDWNGTSWNSNSSIVAGLGYEFSGAPKVFNDGSTWKLINGKTGGTFSGYQWNTSTSQWDTDSNIVSGLACVGSYSTPTIFNDSGTWKLISGRGNDNFHGYRWNNAPVTSNLMTESQTNPTQLTTNVTAPYFNWSYLDSDGDTQYSWEIQVGTVLGLSDMWASGQLLGTDLNDIYAGSALARNVTYYLQVRTNDDLENSSWATGTFKINALPVVNNISITPGAPTNTDDLVVNNDTATDGDGDPTSVFYKWYKDDVHQPALDDIITVNTSNTTNGEIWKVGVIPNDTYENGTESLSATVTIGSGNYAPTLTAITTNVSAKKYGYDILVSTIDAFDLDNTSYVLHVGNSTGASNLCNSSSTPNGTEANCTFTVPWTSGIHTLYGRLTDVNDTSAEETIIFTVDVTPPVYVSSGVNPASISTSETTAITASITLDNGAMDYVTVKVRDNNMVSTNYTMIDVNGTWTYTYSPVAAGSYYVTTIYAADDSGNVMSPQSVSHLFTVTDVTGGAGGAGGAAPNITVVGDLTLDPPIRDTYFFYTAFEGDRKGIYTFIANRNLESCTVEPNDDATCEIIDGYIVKVTLTVNEDVKSYDGVLTVRDETDHITSSRLVVRIINLWSYIPTGTFNIGPLSAVAYPLLEVEGTLVVGIKTWFITAIIGLFVVAVYMGFKRR